MTCSPVCSSCDPFINISFKKGLNIPIRITLLALTIIGGTLLITKGFGWGIGLTVPSAGFFLTFGIPIGKLIYDIKKESEISDAKVARLADMKDEEKSIQILKGKTLNVNHLDHKTGRALLIEAIDKRKFKLVDHLLSDAKTDVNISTENGNMPLLSALWQHRFIHPELTQDRPEYLRIIKTLLRREANFHKAAIIKYIPFIVDISLDDPELAKVLETIKTWTAAELLEIYTATRHPAQSELINKMRVMEFVIPLLKEKDSDFFHKNLFTLISYAASEENIKSIIEKINYSREYDGTFIQCVQRIYEKCQYETLTLFIDKMNPAFYKKLGDIKFELVERNQRANDLLLNLIEKSKS